MKLFLAVVITYLVGAIPTGYLFGRLKKIDIRMHGSGNVGATNVLRTVGKLPAILTLLIDILKGLVAVTFLARLFYGWVIDLEYSKFVAILAFVVVAGHNWTIFLGFKGGKGVATTAGVLLGVCPKLLLIGLITWVIVFIFSRIVSLSSIISAVVIPVTSYLMPYANAIRIATILLGIMTIIRHKSNILRLLKGEEKRVGVKV